MKSIAASKLDPAVWSEIEKIIKNPAILEQEIQQQLSQE